MTRQEDIDEYMSNKAIFVDEAHNIATVKDTQNSLSVDVMMKPTENLLRSVEQTLRLLTYSSK